MPSGLALPSRTSRGRLLLSDGEAQLAKIVMIAAGPRENTNPWNEAGIQTAPFRLNDQTMRAQIRYGLEAHFVRLKANGRASLAAVAFADGNDGELFVTVTYNDLVRRAEHAATVVVPFGGA